jgi:hypothetical protein
MPQYKGATLFSSNLLLRIGGFYSSPAAFYRETISNGTGTAKLGMEEIGI